MAFGLSKNTECSIKKTHIKGVQCDCFDPISQNQQTVLLQFYIKKNLKHCSITSNMLLEKFIQLRQTTVTAEGWIYMYMNTMETCLDIIC